MRNFPRSLSDYPAKLRGLVGKDDPVILEVGCNDGEDTARFLQLFPRATLHCFEVDPRALAQFKAKGLVSDRCQLHEQAVTSFIGTATFHQSGGTTPGASKQDWDMSGSLNEPRFHLQQSPWCTFENKIEVPVTTLDATLEQRPELTIIDLLWLDVQGGEANVFRGAHRALARTRYVYTEFCHTKEPLYDGSMSLAETQEMLGDSWRLLATFEGYNALLGNRRHVRASTPAW